MSEFTVLQDGHSVRVEHGLLNHLLQAERPTVYFSTLIGDSVLTLPTLRALGEMFDAPLTVLCPKIAFDLCFREVDARLVDITGTPPVGPALGPPSNRGFDYDTLAAEVGPVDVFINAVPWDVPSNVFVRPLRQRLAPTTSIGFPTGDSYDVVVPRDVPHSADLTFKLARLFDPSARIETYARPVPVPPAAQERSPLDPCHPARGRKGARRARRRQLDKEAVAGYQVRGLAGPVSVASSRLCGLGCRDGGRGTQCGSRARPRLFVSRGAT